MDGATIAKIVEEELKRQGKTRPELCAAIGITSAAFSNWKNGGQPRQDKIDAIEEFLGISLSDYGKPDIRETLRDDLRILLRSAEDLPPSSVYALIAQIEREKEKNAQ